MQNVVIRMITVRMAMVEPEKEIVSALPAGYGDSWPIMSYQRNQFEWLISSAWLEVPISPWSAISPSLLCPVCPPCCRICCSAWNRHGGPGWIAPTQSLRRRYLRGCCRSPYWPLPHHLQGRMVVYRRVQQKAERAGPDWKGIKKRDQKKSHENKKKEKERNAKCVSPSRIGGLAFGEDRHRHKQRPVSSERGSEEREKGKNENEK